MGVLKDAVRQGTKRDVLVAMRDIIAETIENTTSGRDVAALTKRLVEVSDLIDALPDPNATNPVDDMADLIREYDDYDETHPEYDD